MDEGHYVGRTLVLAFPVGIRPGLKLVALDAEW
jgi:hypothetical protein